jgi:phosphotriesterase-related protein
MASVNTVLGPISADKLGITLMHEHTAIGPADWDKDPGQDVRAVAVRVIEAVKQARSFGVKTIVNAGPQVLGRSIELDRIVAEETGVNIVISTGMYMMRRELPSSSESATIDRLYDLFMQEITQGIGDTSVKAGAIKVATSHKRIFPYEEAVLKAAARASRDTGVPVISHTEEGTMGPDQAMVMTEAGADPRKLVIGHMCGNADLAYQVATLERDVSVSFDRWGLGIIYPDMMRLAALIGLLGIGLGNRIVLSHDFIPVWIEKQPETPDFIKPLISEWSYTHIFRNIIPRLKEAGVTDSQVNAMLVDNPKRIFE